MNRITKLKPNEVFVFGSNLAGRHGAGAAKDAKMLFGAVNGIGVGPAGQSYAMPTKDHHLRTLDLKLISRYLKEFLFYANTHPELTFIVTPIGCGLAGLKPSEIGPIFKGHPSNVKLPPEFLPFQ